MLSDPDITHVEESLRKLDFLVVQDIFLTETARLADVVLPGTTFAERKGTYTNTERRVQVSYEVVPPVGGARPDWEIIAGISKRMGYPMDYASAADIMKEIASVTPQYGGISYERLEAGEQLAWPCLDAKHPGTRFLHKGRFTRGRGLFHAIEFKPPDETPDDRYPMVLTTGRVLYHFHTATMTRKTRGLEELCPEPFVEIHPEDARALKIGERDMVRVSTRRGHVTIRAEVTRRVDRGTIFIPFHFHEAAANVLTNTALDPVAKIPEFKACAASVERIQ
jgi:predicted molibdopterin-dependent oxidoreductase YjgC